jgi:AraC-like DNA-binding protein
MVDAVVKMQKTRLAELLETLAVKEGFSASNLKEVQFIRASKSHPRAPIIYEPSIIIVAQGRKRVFLGDQVYNFDPYNYLVLSVPLPFECETEATPQKPLLALSIKVDISMLVELLMEMDDDMKIKGTVRGVYSTELTDQMTSATVRLLECLKSPVDSCILGSQIVREIIYRALCEEQGAALRAVAARHSRFSQIAKALRLLHQEYDKEINVEALAKESNMSVSTFHHNFKAVTSTSPLQYLKNIRLHKARILMVQDGLNAGTAADRVGYLSASQFSREFKRFFGTSPADDAARMRAMAD